MPLTCPQDYLSADHDVAAAINGAVSPVHSMQTRFACLCVHCGGYQ